MRKAVLMIACLSLFPLLTAAQETPAAEVFGGYQFTHIGSGGVSENLNGWNASVAVNVDKDFGVAGDFSAAYKSINGVSLKIYTYTFGPVANLNHQGKFNPFVHALFGGAHGSASLNGTGTSTNGFTMMMGGGADAKVSPHFAVRLFQADWVYYRFQGTGESKNVRLSAGVVARF
jgi:hypothetical protein